MANGIFRTVFIFVFISSMPLGARAAQPQEKPLEQLPPPKLSMPPAGDGPFYVPYPIYPAYPQRLDTRNVWSLFAPDQTGKMRPRVVMSPFGSYYLYNGQPYPWTTTQPRLVMPKTSD